MVETASEVVTSESAPPTIRADRPFLYASRHQPPNAVSYLGQVVDALPLN